MLPLASCITPTYGRPNLLQEMYWCWNEQTYPNKELIILNDEENVVYTSSDIRVKIFNFNERFAGLGAKRNFLIEHASNQSKFICPFDDDDLFFPNHIESLIEGFSENMAAHRTKNRRHFIAKNNIHDGIIENDWPFFGASCFLTKTMKQFKFKDNYVMGEDVDFINDNNIITHIISHKQPTFVYRLGMGIIHASGHRIVPSSESDQKQLYEKINNSIHRKNEKIEIKLNATLSPQTSLLYRELLNRRTWI